MKKLLLLFLVVFGLAPSFASAHTGLATSNPAAGQVVKEDLSEIVLTYEGKIESLSTMKLLKDGQEVPFVTVEPKENQLIGTLSAPLEDGAFSINWSVAGEDGHPITGEIPFTVQKEVKSEPQTDLNEQVTKEPITKVPAVKEDTKKQTTSQEENRTQNNRSTFNNTIIIFVVVVIIALGLFMVLKRKH